MALRDTSILGIDLHPQEIRVVQMKVRSNKAVIGKIGRSATPEGTIVDGQITDSSSVSVALRLLLNSMEVGAITRAVVGVQGGATIVRNLTVPPVPDSELPTIVAGEVAHYGLIQSEGGSFGYMHLNALPRGVTERVPEPVAKEKRETSFDPESPENNPTLVTVVAVEGRAILSLKYAIEEAHLSVEAVEPCQYGMFRTIMASTSPSATFFALLTSPANTDIAFVFEGKIIGYRRIDIGSTLLADKGSEQASELTVRPKRSAMVDEYGHKIVAQPVKELNANAVDNLSVEIQRTLDYYQRQFTAATVFEQVYLAIDDSRLVGLAPYLSTSLGVTVECVRPASGAVDAQSAIAEIDGGLGATYAAAAGLALQGAILNRVPRIDLFINERAGVKRAEINRNFRGSIVASVLAIILGIALYMLFHRQTAVIEAQTAEIDARTELINKAIGLTHADRARLDDQYQMLRSEGIPFSILLDYVAASFQQGTNLVSINIAPDLSVTMQGKATSQAAMVETNQTLQKCPVLTDLKLVSFTQQGSTDGSGVDFQMTGKTVSSGRIELPGVGKQ